jgi:Na+-driven multidrug efflux pump
MVAALAEPHELSLVNMLGWASVGVSLAAAYVGARWGLAGVIYGVALGWYLRAAIASALILRHLRLPAALPATAP